MIYTSLILYHGVTEMNSSSDRIRKWLENGKKRRSTHVIVTYNLTEKDFRPIYVGSNQTVRSHLNSLNNDYSQKPVEVYDLSMDINKQLLQARAWNT